MELAPITAPGPEAPVPEAPAPKIPVPEAPAPALPALLSLLHLDRYRNEGTRVYSPHAGYTEARERYRPDSRHPSFHLPVFELSAAKLFNCHAEGSGSSGSRSLNPGGGK